MIRVSPALLIPLAGIIVLAVLLAWLGKIPLSYNLRNLIVRWKTTFVTALAFTLVVSLLIVMMAFINGMYGLTESSGNPANVVVLSEGATDEAFSNLQFADAGELETHPDVVRSNGKPMCSREAYLVVNQAIADALPGRPRRRFLQLRGLDDPQLSAAIHGLQLYAGGQWFSQAGVQQLPGDGAGATEARPAIEVVIGEGIARELGRDRHSNAMATARNPERLDVGDVFTLGERQWLIVGVLKSSGSTFDSEVWARAPSSVRCSARKPIRRSCCAPKMVPPPNDSRRSSTRNIRKRQSRPFWSRSTLRACRRPTGSFWSG